MFHNLLMCSLTHGFSGLLISNQSFQGIDPLFFCGAHPAIFSVFDHVFHLTVTAHDTRNLYKGSLCPLILGFAPVEQAVLQWHQIDIKSCDHGRQLSPVHKRKLLDAVLHRLHSGFIQYTHQLQVNLRVALHHLQKCCLHLGKILIMRFGTT